MTSPDALDQPPPAAPAFVPPDARWIPRLVHEMEDVFAPADAAASARMEGLARGMVALAGMTAHPWALARSQCAMWNLAFAHAAAMQADWLYAWWRFLATPRQAAAEGR